MSSGRHHRRSRKARLHLPREEAAAYLRDLADQLAAGRVRAGGSDVELGEGTVRVRQSLEEKHGRRRVEVRLRIEADGEGQLPPPSYAGLKKRMKEELRELRRAVERGEPALELVRAFEEDATRMVQFPGRGDADYPSFTVAVSELRSAAEGGKAEPLRAALDELDRLRRRCHHRHR